MNELKTLSKKVFDILFTKPMNAVENELVCQYQVTSGEYENSIHA